MCIALDGIPQEKQEQLSDILLQKSITWTVIGKQQQWEADFNNSRYVQVQTDSPPGLCCTLGPLGGAVLTVFIKLNWDYVVVIMVLS